MKLLCVSEYEYRDGEIVFPFHAGTEYAVADDMAAKILEASPESFEEVEKPKGKSSREK